MDTRSWRALDCASRPLTVTLLFGWVLPSRSTDTLWDTNTVSRVKCLVKMVWTGNHQCIQNIAEGKKPTSCGSLCVGTAQWRASTVHSCYYSQPQRETQMALNRLKRLHLTWQVPLYGASFTRHALTVQPSTPNPARLHPGAPSFVSSFSVSSLTCVQCDAQTRKSVMVLALVETVSIHSQGFL